MFAKLLLVIALIIAVLSAASEAYLYGGYGYGLGLYPWLYSSYLWGGLGYGGLYGWGR